MPYRYLPRLLFVMDDYRICEMCKQVTVEALMSPTGFQHYNDLELVKAQAASITSCHLCSLIWKYLYGKHSAEYKLMVVCYPVV
jgi:hypothetical protein